MAASEESTASQKCGTSATLGYSKQRMFKTEIFFCKKAADTKKSEKERACIWTD